jgi:hypothetical protein
LLHRLIVSMNHEQGGMIPRATSNPHLRQPHLRRKHSQYGFGFGEFC